MTGNRVLFIGNNLHQFKNCLDSAKSDGTEIKTYEPNIQLDLAVAGLGSLLTQAWDVIIVYSVVNETLKEWLLNIIGAVSCKKMVIVDAKRDIAKVNKIVVTPILPSEFTNAIKKLLEQ